MRLDALDLQILRLLQEDARASFREIAKRLESTTPTVSARVKALEDIGLITGYAARVDPAVLGGSAHVLTVTVQPPSAHAALASLAGMPGVRSAHLLAGGRIVVHLHLRSPGATLAQLHRLVAELPGILTYDASEVIEGRERTADAPLPENVDVPCHQCKGLIHGDPIKGKFAERTHVFCCRTCLAAFGEKFQKVSAQASAGAKPVERSRLGPGRPRQVR